MAATPRGARARARLVVIDDDATFLALMRDLLEVSEGYEVHTLTEWETAPTRVRALQPDLVILDVVIQGTERGWDVLEQISSDPETRRIPVLVCSAALGTLREREARLRREGVDVMPKPFDLEALLERVQALLSRAAAD